jgi:hypothetical protein
MQGKFKANWAISGLPTGEVKPGDVVSLDLKDAQPLIACGVLTQVEEIAAQPQGAQLGASQTVTAKQRNKRNG